MSKIRRATAFAETEPITAAGLIMGLAFAVVLAVVPLAALGLTVQAQSSTDAKLRALVVLGVMLAVAITAGLTLLLTGNLFVRDARDRPRRGVSFATAGSAMLLANLYPAIAGFPLAAIVGIAMGFCYPALPIAVPMMVRRYRRTRRKSKGAPREP